MSRFIASFASLLFAAVLLTLVSGCERPVASCAEFDPPPGKRARRLSAQSRGDPGQAGPTGAILLQQPWPRSNAIPNSQPGRPGYMGSTEAPPPTETPAKVKAEKKAPEKPAVVQPAAAQPATVQPAAVPAPGLAAPRPHHRPPRRRLRAQARFRQLKYQSAARPGGKDPRSFVAAHRTPAGDLLDRPIAADAGPAALIQPADADTGRGSGRGAGCQAAACRPACFAAASAAWRRPAFPTGSATGVSEIGELGFQELFARGRHLIGPALGAVGDLLGRLGLVALALGCDLEPRPAFRLVEQREG